MSKQSSKLGVILAVLLAVVAVVLALVIAGVIPVQTRSNASDADSAISPAGTLTPLQIFDEYAPGVVEVRASFVEADGTPSGQGLGSGFLVSADGYILTNAHVVTSEGQDAASVVVVFRVESGANPSSARVNATLVGSDEYTDVALLKIEPSDAPVLQPLVLGTGAAVQVGEPVAAIGNPLGLSFSLTSGIVSATERNLTSPNGAVIPDGIQTDAAINSGNSGGPLIDSAGRVIGIDTMIISQSGGSQGLGFAVAIDTAVRVMDQLKASGTVSHAFLGVSGQTLNPEIAEALGVTPDHGVLVAAVLPGSPADVAGIRGGTEQVTIQGQPFVVGGDVITEVDGKALATAQDLAASVAQREAGDTITLTVVRDGKTQQVEVELTAKPTGA